MANGFQNRLLTLTTYRLPKINLGYTRIAVRLGHTDAFLHADTTIKQAALDRTRPLNVKRGTYQPKLDILDWLTAL